MTETGYLDVEIRIFARQDAGYPVEVTLGREQTFSQGALVGDLLPWVPSGDAVADGRRLFDALLGAGSARDAWIEARGRSARRRVRLWIDVEATELHALPWELLHNGESLLAADAKTPFSRYLPLEKPWGRAQPQPLRVLAMISNPADLEALYNLPAVDVATERQLLEQALFALEGEALTLEVLEPPATLARLETALQNGADVLHFVGHGVFNRRRQQAALYLQDEVGDTQIVRETQVVEMLARQEALPRLVVLAACESATRATAGAFLGLGPRLVHAGVPVVVAMQERVTVKTARKFTLAFYRALVQGGAVDRAANVARSFLLTQGRPDAAIPVLFMRLRSGRLWDGEGASEVPDSGMRVEIGGDVSGQVAVGNRGSTLQVGKMSGGQLNVGDGAPGATAVTEADREELRRWIADVRERATVDAPPEVQEEAAAKLASLEDAIFHQPPDVATMETLLDWFRAEAPRLAGAILHSLILHPVTRQRAQAAGGEVAEAYRRLVTGFRSESAGENALRTVEPA